MNRINFIYPLFLFVIVSCGVKGDLQPKGLPEPLAPARLVLKQQGDSILLKWSIPEQNQDGSPLTDLAGFRVDLYTYPPDDYCPECRDQETVAKIFMDNPAPARIADGTIYYRESGFQPGRGVRFRVRVLTRAGGTGPAAEAHRTVVSYPPPPSNIETEPIDRGVQLFWSLPNDVQETGDLLGVNIYRGTGSVLDSVPINTDPIKGNNFTDFGLENGTTYIYAIRTVVRNKDFLVESHRSEIAEAVPRPGL